MVMRDTSEMSIEANTPRREKLAPAVWDPMRRPQGLGYAPRPLPDAMDVWSDARTKRDRSAIIMNEWGPFDWQSPMLWPTDSSRAVPLRLRVVGPPGAWTLTSRRGIATLSAMRGRVGDTIVVTPERGSESDWSLTLEYRGRATVSPRGDRRGAGVPYEFSYERFEPPTTWDVGFYPWADSASDPRSRREAFAALTRRAAAASQRVPRLDYMWYRPTITGVPQTNFAIVATTTVTLAAGTYTLRSISDDAIRVWVDDSLAIDNWTPHESEVNAVDIGPGTHRLRVEHFQVGGWTELRVEIVRGRQRSTGSPGPH
jgi:hypothetical protein